MRPKGSAQFEGDVGKALKEFTRNASDRHEVLRHAATTLSRMSRECVAQRHHLEDVADGIEVEGEPCSITVVDGKTWSFPSDAIQVLP